MKLHVIVPTVRTNRNYYNLLIGLDELIRQIQFLIIPDL